MRDGRPMSWQREFWTGSWHWFVEMRMLFGVGFALYFDPELRAFVGVFPFFDITVKAKGPDLIE